MTQQDQIHRYLFEHHQVRGELVQLADTYRHITEAQDYPAPVRALLGELLVATSLLTATLKFEGSITVQLQGKAEKNGWEAVAGEKEKSRRVSHPPASGITVADSAALCCFRQRWRRHRLHQRDSGCRSSHSACQSCPVP